MCKTKQRQGTYQTISFSKILSVILSKAGECESLKIFVRFDIRRMIFQEGHSLSHKSKNTFLSDSITCSSWTLWSTISGFSISRRGSVFPSIRASESSTGTSSCSFFFSSFMLFLYSSYWRNQIKQEISMEWYIFQQEIKAKINNTQSYS